MSPITENGFGGEGGQFVVTVGFDERNALDAALLDLVQSAVQLLFVVDADNDEIGVVEMGRQETLADHFHTGVRRLDNDLLVGQVLTDKNVDVALGRGGGYLMRHDFLQFVDHHTTTYYSGFGRLSSI